MHEPRGIGKAAMANQRGQPDQKPDGKGPVRGISQEDDAGRIEIRRVGIDAREDDYEKGVEDPDFTGFHRLEYGLFEQKTVTFQPRGPNGEEGPPQKIADYWAVSEEKLNQLPAEKFIEMRDNGVIGAIYAHMVSLLNWQKVIQRAMREAPPVAGNA